jgi:phosphate transport system substrate-binding protein
MLLIGVCGLVACNCDPTELWSGTTPSAATPQSTATQPIAGTITFAGSTTLQPLAHELGLAFNVEYPNVVLDIAGGGSLVGIHAVHDGTVDIGMASRSLKPEEAEGITQHQVAVDVIAVVIHISNPVENLTLEQLRGIYLGDIVNWNQVGGRDQVIVAVARGQNSGTRGAFDQIVLDGQVPKASDMHLAVTAGDMAVAVMNNPAAIGYVGFGNLEPDLKMVSIDGIPPSEETAQGGSYQLVRPLMFLTGPLTQPLAHMFVDYALSDRGQQIVVASGWVPTN